MAKPIIMICECCGKTKEIYVSRRTGVKFFTCSDKCKHIMTGLRTKKFWASLSKEKREEFICKQHENRENHGKGLIEFWQTHNEKMLEHTVKMMKSHKGGSVKDRSNLKLSVSPCVLLKAHSIVMKNDPERLTTEFCKSLIKGIKCNYDGDKTDI